MVDTTDTQDITVTQINEKPSAKSRVGARECMYVVVSSNVSHFRARCVKHCPGGERFPLKYWIGSLGFSWDLNCPSRFHSSLSCLLQLPCCRVKGSLNTLPCASRVYVEPWS